MLEPLLDLAAARNLTTGFRVMPPTGGRYQIHLWVGRSIGDRNEWYQRFETGVPREEAFAALVDKALHYLANRSEIASADAPALPLP